jgi:hypothetical protein
MTELCEQKQTTDIHASDSQGDRRKRGERILGPHPPAYHPARVSRPTTRGNDLQLTLSLLINVALDDLYRVAEDQPFD